MIRLRFFNPLKFNNQLLYKRAMNFSVQNNPPPENNPNPNQNQENQQQTPPPSNESQNETKINPLWTE